MRLIVGLGNPGERYALTRHNIGVRVLELAAARWSVKFGPAGRARWGNGRIGASEVCFSAPLAWMNETGPVVKALLDRLTLSPRDLIVIHDDLDLELGRLRIKRNGGSGGHNGLLSILTALETDEFCRLKVGIGRPAPDEDPAEYVLTPFPPEEIPRIEETRERAVAALESLVVEGVEAAMNRFNVRVEEEDE